MDSFPADWTASQRLFWLAEAEPVLRAQEWLQTGEVPDDALEEVATLATGSEDAAQDVLEARLEAKAKEAAMRAAFD